ncbi:MAG TPA: hypothetical protein VM118_09860, partial [Acidobacteriota bacterium]|nr:hypothetical protein [Acidobacteriota bacterium]
LRKAGIKGIKYLDGGSRGERFSFNVSADGMGGPRQQTLSFDTRVQAEHARSQQMKAFPNRIPTEIKEAPSTHNYVMFDPKDTQILKTMGIGGLGILGSEKE